MNSLPPDLIYESASATAEVLASRLREEGCELIVAVTHMREPNDIKLANKTSAGLIDLILGGHDHFYSCQKINSTYILRSGTDFKQLSYIEAWRTEDGRWDFSITRRDIVRSIPEDPTTVQLVDKLTSSLKTKLEKPIGYTVVPLDARFTTVRTRESNLGNFVCDLMRYYYGTDCALMAAGTIRGDQIYSPGLLRLKDIMNCFPFEDPVVVVKITGKAISEALENSVSLVPALEGRYPQVSNIVFEYDPKLPAGCRVRWIRIDGVGLDPAKIYAVATRGYMARGKDGFNSLLAKSEGGEAEEVVSEENGVLISTILRQYFLSLKVVGKWGKRNPNLRRLWGGVQRRLSQQGGISDQGPSQVPTASMKENQDGRSSDKDFYESSTTSSTPDKHQTPLASRPLQTNGSINRPTITLSSGSEPERDIVDTESESDSSSDSSDTDLISTTTPHTAHPLLSHTTSQTFSVPAHLNDEFDDYLYRLARFYARRWMKAAGVKEDSVAMVDEHTESVRPSWTRGISPRLEGRIRVVGGRETEGQHELRNQL